MRIVTGFLLLLVAALLLAAPLDAQLPTKRVRLKKDPKDQGIRTQPIALPNRMVFKSLKYERTERGLALKGSVIADFVIEPGDDKRPNPVSGPLMGLTIEVGLYEIVGIDDTGPLVGEAIRCVTSIAEGDFPMAEFELFAGEKPLPPGRYRVIASLDFRAQPTNLREAVRFCRDVYGYENGASVWDDNKLRDRYHREFVEATLETKAIGEVIVGDLLLPNGRLDTAALDPKNANGLVICTDSSFQIYSDLERYEAQLKPETEKAMRDEMEKEISEVTPPKNADANWRDNFAKKKRADLDLVLKAMKEKATFAIAAAGGAMTPQEKQQLATQRAARERIRDKVWEWEFNYRTSYWIFTDGVLEYQGFKVADRAGFNMWEACGQGGNTEKSTNDRTALASAKDRAEREAKRKEAWKFYPPEAQKMVEDFWKKRLDSSEWDAKNFVKKTGDKVELDVKKWRDFRNGMIKSFTATSNEWLAKLDTSRRYATTKWPDALRNAQDARDRALRLLFVWEYDCRTNANKMKRDPKDVEADWAQEAQDRPEIALLIRAAQTTPGVAKSEYEQTVAEIRKIVEISRHAADYRKYVETGKIPPRPK